MATKALINQQLIGWARERADLSIGQLAKLMHIRPEILDSWEIGNAVPTFIQAERIAHFTHIPFGYLFLETAPNEELPLPDLRTKSDEPVPKPSVNLIDVIKQVMLKQSWYLEYIKNTDRQKLDFVGKFNVGSNIADIVSDIKKELKFDGVQRGSGDEYFSALVSAAENAGVLVMRSGMVGNNTHRKLSVNEFRGFAISDPLAPVIFINIADAPVARLFTLVHELAHLWIGATGVSNLAPTNVKREEKICNAIAGEFLVPESEFHKLWIEGESLSNNLIGLANHYHVSQLVISRRARDLGKITTEDYLMFYNSEIDRYKAKESSGGNFYAAAGTKNSHVFSKAVLIETFSGRLLIRDASRLLGIQPNKLKTYAEKIGI